MSQAPYNGGMSKKQKPTRSEYDFSAEDYHRIKKDPVQRNKFIMKNTPLVRSILKSGFSSIVRPDLERAISYSDCFQEGVMGLMLAFERFDPTKGRFSTYAHFWVRQKIIRFLGNHLTTIRVPLYLRQKHRELEKEAKSDKKLSVARQLELEQIRWNIRTMPNPVPIQSETNTFNDGTERINLPTFEPDHEDMVILRDEIDFILSAMGRACTQKEIEVLNLRYLSDGECVPTLKQVGLSYGVSRERIRQIEKSALDKVREAIGAN